MGIFDKLKKGLGKTRSGLVGGLKSVLTLGRAVDDELLEELEETLIRGDLGPRTAHDLVEAARKGARKGRVKTAEDLKALIQEEVVARLEMGGTALAKQAEGPTVALVCGVNVSRISSSSSR